MSRKRSAIASGGASKWERLPRLRGSDSSSVVPSPTATNTSWSARALARVCMDVAGGDRGDAEPVGELGEQAVAAAVAAAEGALELDAQAVGAEGGQEPLARRPGLGMLSRSIALREHAVARAAGQADESLGVARDRLNGTLG